MQIKNCGIAALEKLKAVTKISAFSLIQMAKENGLNLIVYQVKIDDLVRVPRPMIAHAKDHFVFIKNGEPLPDYEFTGFVISEKGFNGSRVIKHSEAKNIIGSKKGNKILGPILKVVGAVVGGIVGGPAGAIIGAGANLGGTAVSTGGKVGKPLNIISDLATGAFSTGLGGKAAAPLAATSAAAPKLSEGDFSGALLAGGGAFLGTKANQGFAEGFNAVQTNPAGNTPASALQKTAGGFRNIFKGTPFPSSPGQIPTSIATPGGYGGSVTIPGAGSTNIFNARNLATGAGIIGAAGSPTFNPSGQPGYDTIFRGGELLSQPFVREAAALAGSQIGKPDTSALNRGVQGAAQDYSALKTYIGDNPLPAATEQELLKYVNTPIDKIGAELSVGNETVINGINQSFDRQIQALTRQYSGAGQNVTGSSDLRDEIRKINGDRENALRIANNELKDYNLGRAIQAKQFALARGFEQNKYDSDLALELAKIAGQDQRLKLAIETNNYNEFQDIIAQILYMGYQGQQSNSPANTMAV